MESSDSLPPMDEILANLTYLTQNITNLDLVLIHLMEKGIISTNERQIIVAETTDLNKNFQLLDHLRKKDWNINRSVVLEVLKLTNNSHCASRIESGNLQAAVTAIEQRVQTSSSRQSDLLHAVPIHKKRLHHLDENCTDTDTNLTNLSKKLKKDTSFPKWWPEKKYLPNSFYERKSGEILLVNKLKDMLRTESSDCMTVITPQKQKLAVSGLGGIGKTTLAKWFASYYENDYDHILWIDCGEGILLTTFTKLANDLKAPNISDNGLKHLAEESFKILNKLNCLLIYDNAECYVGHQGIKEVLPKDKNNFHIIITSRNREWANRNGDGEIPRLNLDVFDCKESVEFMNGNLTDCPDKDNNKLENLCEMLGHLPLALQISIATINGRELYLDDYINQIQDTDYIIDTPFDDYEVTINKTMQVSLNLIKKYEKNIGQLALKILRTFSYITPDDVSCNFFQAIEKNKTSEINGATDLLHKYCLITKRRESSQNHVISIHRLLQHVIRLNENATKNETLTRILCCKGFLKYKLIPYSHADDQLKLQFPDIRDELMDKVKLIELLKSKRFPESVELSRLINESKKTDVSSFNYAVCLKYNYQINDAKSTFEALYKKSHIVNTEEKATTLFINRMGIISSFKTLAKEAVAGQLFLIYANEKDDKASEVVLQSKRAVIPEEGLLDLSSLKFAILKTSIVVKCHGDGCVEIAIQKDDKENKVILKKNFATAETRFPPDVRKIEIVDSTLTGWNISSLTSLSIKNSKLFLGKEELTNLTNVEGRKNCLLRKISDLENIERLDIDNLSIYFDNSTSTEQRWIENYSSFYTYVIQLLHINKFLFSHSNL